MFRNYLTVAVRNLLRHGVYSLINIIGLAVGIAFCVLTFLFVRNEWTHDTFHEDADRKIPGNSSIRFDFLLPYARMADAWDKEIFSQWRSSQTYMYVHLSSVARAGDLVRKFPGFITEHWDDAGVGALRDE